MTPPIPLNDFSTSNPNNTQSETIQQQHSREAADPTVDTHIDQPSLTSLADLPSNLKRLHQSTMDLLSLFSSFILWYMRTPPIPSRRTISDQAIHNAHSGDDHPSQRGTAGSESIRRELADMTRGIRNPTSFWIPGVSVYAILYYALRAVEHQETSLHDRQPFKESCPEHGRRTQAAVLVKLFAATVTTVAIHGHLGSLNGSDSWRRELARALEVLIIPLAPLFQFANHLFYEITSLLSYHQPVSIRYRIARACQYQVSGTAIMDVGSLGWAVNPKHSKMIAVRFDLKWFGRVFLLTVLLGQVSPHQECGPQTKPRQQFSLVQYKQ
jgi:hypothetical protein